MACNAAETDAGAAELGNADCSLSGQQLHRPVLASLPPNQFIDAPAAGTFVAVVCACLLVDDAAKA